MTDLKGPQYKTRQAQGDHGVDLDKLRGQLDKLHSLPQLQAGLNGKLSRVAPKVEPKVMSPEEQQEAAVKALAQCVAVAEGEWIDKTIRKIFRNDYISASYNRRLNQMKAGNLEPMRALLNEYQIEINHQKPEEGYVLPEDCVLYRRLEIKKGSVVRGEMVWEWSNQV